MYMRAKDYLKEIYLFVDLGRFAIDSKNPPPHTHTQGIVARRKGKEGGRKTLLCTLCGFLWALDSLCPGGRGH